MQSDPKGVMEKHGGNPEFRETLQEFFAFMSEHMEATGEKIRKEEEAKKKEEERKKKE